MASARDAVAELHFVIADATVGQNVKRGAADGMLSTKTRGPAAGGNSRTINILIGSAGYATYTVIPTFRLGRVDKSIDARIAN